MHMSAKTALRTPSAADFARMRRRLARYIVVQHRIPIAGAGRWNAPADLAVNPGLTKYCVRRVERVSDHFVRKVEDVLLTLVVAW